jgi:hypothetical protein
MASVAGFCCLRSAELTTPSPGMKISWNLEFCIIFHPIYHLFTLNTSLFICCLLAALGVRGSESESLAAYLMQLCSTSSGPYFKRTESQFNFHHLILTSTLNFSPLSQLFFDLGHIRYHRHVRASQAFSKERYARFSEQAKLESCFCQH